MKTKTLEGVSIIGLGPMGQAMAKTLLKRGHSVTVWNRTAGKAEDLVKQGALHAATVTDALNSNNLIILSLTDYDVMYKVLNMATGALQGKVLVNLSSDTPEKARDAEKWAKGHGAHYIAGGIMADPPLVGKPEAYVLYSGNEEVFSTHRSTLEVLGKADYLGSDPGLSLLYYQALLDMLFTSAAGVLHAIALVRSANISAASFEPYVQDFLTTLPYFFKGMGEEVDKKQYNGELNNMHMMAAGMGHVAQASRDAKIDSLLPDTLEEIYQKTVGLGYGKAGLTSLIEVLGRPAV